jgi:hypothetical protein
MFKRSCVVLPFTRCEEEVQHPLDSLESLKDLLELGDRQLTEFLFGGIKRLVDNRELPEIPDRTIGTTECLTETVCPTPSNVLHVAFS